MPDVNGSRYVNMTKWQLDIELASRQPELFMDIFAVAQELRREHVLLLLRLSDLDRAEGRKGRGMILPQVDPDDLPPES